MGLIKGQREYRLFKKGTRLTRKEAMLAKCYECNGSNESGEDCGVEGCPMYGFHPHRQGKR